MDSRTLSGHCPPLYNFLSRRLLHLRPPSSRTNLKFSNGIRRFRPNYHLIFRGQCIHGLFDSVMAKLLSIRSICRIRATNKIGVLTSKELFEVKREKGVLQKGLLLEFRKDAHKLLLAVSQNPDGKKNWMVYDQNGTLSSIKPQQVTYIVPGIEDFDHTDIPEFIHKAQDLLDPTILECAWGELLEKSKLVTSEELAEIIYGSREPLESYCAHLLLSKDDIYFSEVECKGSSTTYEPRPVVQVEELLHRKRLKETSEKEFEEFVQLLMSAKALPSCSKPSRSSWTTIENVCQRIESLEAHAIDAFKNDEQRRTAGNVINLTLINTFDVAL